MNLGIVRKAILINASGKFFDREVVHNNYYDGYLPSLVQYDCFLYVDFINGDGKLESSLFKNKYYYKDGEIVELDKQGADFIIKRKLNLSELKSQTEALKLLLDKETQMLMEERALIKEQFGELEAEIYDSERENVINVLKTVIDPNITKDFREKLIALAKALMTNKTEISKEQREGYWLLVLHLATNFEQINRQLSLCGEKEIDAQLVWDLYEIINYHIQSSASPWFTCPQYFEMDDRFKRIYEPLKKDNLENKLWL